MGLNWLEVKPSTIEGAGLGLFAARQFYPQSIIGIYMGEYDPNDQISTGYQLKNINARPSKEEEDVQNLTKRMARKLHCKVNVEFGGGYEC